MKIFQNKVIVITGGASGIGKALCQNLIQHQAILWIADCNQEQTEILAKELTQQGGQVRTFLIDVREPQQFSDLFQKVLQEDQRVDYFFNNAGVAVAGEFRDLSLEQWEMDFRCKFMGSDLWES